VLYGRNLLYFYTAPPEGLGLFWPSIHSGMIIILIVAQLMLIAVYLVINSVTAMTLLLVPLPFATFFGGWLLSKKYAPQMEAVTLLESVQADEEAEKPPDAELQARFVAAYTQPAFDLPDELKLGEVALPEAPAPQTKV